MGKVLGVPVVAESVETLEQLEQVRAAGCSLVQGWLLGRPAPAEDLHAFFVEPCADLALAG
jgi:EAL domain-containing protein (putative c-di-GMP-specific phosphodiesterase class I)